MCGVGTPIAPSIAWAYVGCSCWLQEGTRAPKARYYLLGPGVTVGRGSVREGGGTEYIWVVGRWGWGSRLGAALEDTEAPDVKRTCLGAQSSGCGIARGYSLYTQAAALPRVLPGAAAPGYCKQGLTQALGNIPPIALWAPRFCVRPPLLISNPDSCRGSQGCLSSRLCPARCPLTQRKFPATSDQKSQGFPVFLPR